MTLLTNLEHIVSEDDYKKILSENENVMICCGRMGPMCVPVYDDMEELRKKNTHIKFTDMLFDNPNASVIRNLPECAGFMGLPFTVYYKNGKVVKATSSLQSGEQIEEILESEFSKQSNS